MLPEEKKRIQELSRQIVEAHDPDKFMTLIAQMEDLLSACCGRLKKPEASAIPDTSNSAAGRKISCQDTKSA